MISFTADLQAVCCENMRIQKINEKFCYYIPERTRRFVSELKEIANYYMETKKLSIYREDIPVVVYIKFHFRCKSKNRLGFYANDVPSIDGCERAVLDSLNGICFERRAQVCSVTAIKRFAEKDKIFIKVFKI